MKRSLPGGGYCNSMRDRLGRSPRASKDLASIFVLSLLPVVLLANVLFTDQVLVGDNLARFPPWKAYASGELLDKITNGTLDPLYAYYPQRFIAAEIVRNGDLPLWNPYYPAGAPLLATEPWGGFFYPLNIIYYLVNPLEGFGLSACLHLMLAGTFMYLYLRSVHLDRLSSLFGGVAFQLSGYFVVNLMWLVRVSTAAWLPLLFFSFEKYWRERKWRYAILLAFAVGMSILAGMPPVFIFGMMAFGLYVALRFCLVVKERNLKQSGGALAVTLLAIGLGVLLSAVQLIPTLEATPFFERALLDYDDSLDTGRSSLSLATALVPDIFGNPVDPIWQEWGKRPGDYFGVDVPGNYARPNIYAGVLPLLFAAWALLSKRNRHVAYWAVVATISLAIFLNFPTLIYRLLYTVPLFRVGRPVEAKVMYAFAISVLSAWGFSALVERIKEPAKSRMTKVAAALFASAALLLVAVVMTWYAPPTLATGLREWYVYNTANFVRFALLVLACAGLLLLRLRDKVGVHLYCILAIAIVVVDMFYFGWKFNPPQSRQDLLPETGGITFLRAGQEPFRIIRLGGGRKVLPPNTAAVYLISDTQGYVPLMLDYYADFINLIEPDLAGIRHIQSLKSVESLSSKLLDLLNVKYILANPEVGQELLEYDDAHQDIELVYDDEIKIYENRDVLPRAFVVHDFKVLPDKEDIFTELTSERFDPGAYVILEQEPSRLPMVTDLSATDSSARIVDYTPNKVVIEVDAAADGFLILTDLHYAGWKAFVDSEAQDVYKADYIFRAVELTEGQHTVEFVFDPLSFKLGWIISALTAAMLGLSLICDSFRRRHSREVV